MKIEEVELRRIRMPLVSPFRTSRWEEQERECVLLRVRADGLTGWGECVAARNCAYSYETTTTSAHILGDFLIPAMLGREIREIPDYERAIAHVTGHPMAKAALEMALHDLLAQEKGISLQQALGGSGDRVRVGVSVGIHDTTEALLRTVDRYLADGYGRVKLKIRPGRDIAETSAVRGAHPDLPLQVDANAAYTLEEAGRLRALDDLGLLMVEQPLAGDDLLDHARLQKLLRTPLCLDESIGRLDHARQALEIGACRIINIKPGRVGGLLEGKRIHDYCHARGVPVWMGGMLETGIGRAANVALASLPGFTLPGDISASSRYFAEDLIDQPFVLHSGSTLSVPNGPGLGVRVREDILERVTISRVLYGRS
jgi:O-succinylbenzoate synthase